MDSLKKESNIVIIIITIMMIMIETMIIIIIIHNKYIETTLVSKLQKKLTTKGLSVKVRMSLSTKT